MIINNIKNTIKSCKAKDITLIDVSNKLFIVNYILICTSDSKLHSMFIYKKIVKKFKKYIYNNNIEIDKFYEWILIDLNTLIVNIMQKNSRLYYDLENL